MVNHQRTRKRRETAFQFRQPDALHNEFDMPLQLSDSRRERRQHIHRCCARITEIEPYSSNAARVKFVQLLVAYRRVYDRHTARVASDSLQRIQRATIVDSIGRRRHNDISVNAKTSLQQSILLHRCIGRPQRRAGSDRKAIVVDMHVAIDGAGRQSERGRLRPAGPCFDRLDMRPQRRRCHQRPAHLEETSSGRFLHGQTVSVLRARCFVCPLRVSIKSVATLTSVRTASGISANA